MESVRNTASVTLTTRADATALVAMKKRLDAEAGAGGGASYHDIVAKLVAVALRRFPVMNSRWTDGGTVRPGGVHIGIAVDTDAGLIVPVIRNADRLTLLEVAVRSRDLIARARKRRCSLDELQGGTFTISNLGAFGVDAFTPIINAPQTAILGLGAIRREPVVTQDDRVMPRDQITLSLTFDHRVVDGAPAARFLRALCDALEAPDQYL